MTRVCCLAGIEPRDTAQLISALNSVGEPALTVIAGLALSELDRLAPDVLVVDIDHLEVDSLEKLRQLRFVLPDCVIVVLTAVTEASWSRACHLAGANGLLCKASDKSQLEFGFQRAIRDGCFTDPRFVA